MRTRTDKKPKRALRSETSALRDESGNPYDIYIRAHVDELKAENSELREWLAEVVHENALLEAALHRERSDWRGESECEVMNLS